MTATTTGVALTERVRAVAAPPPVMSSQREHELTTRQREILDELVLMVVDRNLRKVGRAAHPAIDPAMTSLEAVRAYLGAPTVAVSGITEEFANDMIEVGPGLDLNEAHSNYLVDVTRCLLDLAVEDGEIDDVDTAAVLRMIAGLRRSR